MTVEGLAEQGTSSAVHVRARGAQVDLHAVLIATEALLRRVPNPTEREIRSHRRHTRCTGYQRIVQSTEAVKPTRPI